MKNKTNLKSSCFILIILLFSVLLISCKIATQPTPIKPDTKISEFESSQGLKKFSSAKEIIDFLQKSAAGQSESFYGTGGIRRATFDVAVAESAPQAKAAESGAVSAGATEYSKTNIQVEGVDEPDFVKNDDKYIYVISQNRLVIVDAYPAENAKILSETKIDGRPRNMFVNKDRLVVFAEGNEEVPVIAQYDFVPRPRYTSTTHVYVYDISDREEPELVKDYNLNGYYFEARMIDEFVYFIVKDDVYVYAQYIDLPVIKQASKAIVRPDIYYFDNPDISYNFHTIASFDIFSDKDEVNAKTFMMGYSNVLYVSQNNIYLTYQKNLPYVYYEKHNEERFYKIVVPLLPSDVQSKIEEIQDDDGLSSYERWDKISDILEEMYNRMEDDERDNLIEKIENAIEDYESQIEIERRKTIIHKIKIEDGDIDYATKGEVPGYLLNQFSLDENNDYLRVATTMEFWGRTPIPLMETVASGTSAEKASILPRPIPETKNVMYNNVYVLDDALETVGKLEAIAPDERIYSTRFLGDRLYMVTFKRIDPLFVIDLSDPKNPEILGQLKIPGFSDYLHPYDEDHIIGIGKETEANDWGGVSVAGVKIALFDVSDVKNPKQVDKYEIGDAGTDSEALRDHKAFLFDKKKNILVIPVTEVKDKPYYDPRLGYYRQRFWQGAYVFGITPEDGIEVKGKITHNEGDEEKDYYYYSSPNAVRRALYMDDVLYTVSAIKVKANDINNIDKEIKEVKLPFEKERYYEYPWY